VPAGGLEPGEVAALQAAVRPCPLLPEHGAGWFGRPGLSGHRLDTSGGHPAAGRDWSPLFRAARLAHGDRRAPAERIPQRHRLGDGLWLREGRREHTGHDSATVVVAGVPTIGGGELLLPGEITLAQGQSYTTPWVYLVASQDGLDGLAAQFHGYLRAQPAHPRSPRPVNLNVWEAVYFRHEFDTLAALADRAARIGVERYVLGDGWFTGRRSDRRVPLRADQRPARGVPDLLREMGLQPGPHRRRIRAAGGRPRRTRPGAGRLRAARPAPRAVPGRRVGVMRGRWRAG
jgi:hypothetical protein